MRQEYQSQHFNPRVYMQQFVKPGTKRELWEYNLSAGTVKPSTPYDSGCADFYHAVALEGGRIDYETIEKEFGPLESRLPELFKTIRSNKHLSEKLWQLFFSFTALQHVRCPGNVSALHSSLSEIHQAAFEMQCEHSEGFKRMLNEQGIDPVSAREEYVIEASTGSALLAMLNQWEQVTDVLSNMKWCFLTAPDGRFFFTCDRPVALWRPSASQSIYPPSLTHSDVEIVFPLSKRACAFGRWQAPYSQLYEPASEEMVDCFNRGMVLNGSVFVYGPTNDPAILRDVLNIKESRNAQTPNG